MDLNNLLNWQSICSNMKSHRFVQQFKDVPGSVAGIGCSLVAKLRPNPCLPYRCFSRKMVNPCSRVYCLDWALHSTRGVCVSVWKGNECKAPWGAGNGKHCILKSLRSNCFLTQSSVRENSFWSCRPDVVRLISLGEADKRTLMSETTAFI